jgi:hypothetical protein
MSFKFDPNAGADRKYISKEGTYTVTVQSVEHKYMPPRTDFYAKLSLVTDEGESTSADIFLKAEKNGTYGRLNQFVAATSTDAEVKSLLARGEFDIDEDFIKQITERSVGRRMKVVVTSREYTRKDGTAGVAYQGSFFRKLAEGPTNQPF